MSEHLEPEPDAILQFPGVNPVVAGVEGYRWRVYQVCNPHPTYLKTYRMQRLDDPNQCLQVTQEVMDRCGRLLVSSEEAD